MMAGQDLGDCLGPQLELENSGHAFEIGMVMRSYEEDTEVYREEEGISFIVLLLASVAVLLSVTCFLLGRLSCGAHVNVEASQIHGLDERRESTQNLKERRADTKENSTQTDEWTPMQTQEVRNTFDSGSMPRSRLTATPASAGAVASIMYYDELRGLCRRWGVATGGTKEDLALRLLHAGWKGPTTGKGSKA